MNGTPVSKVKLATVWLDGCAGCHMSLLDIDEAIVQIAKRVDIVYGPLVDAQEFPEGVDVTLVEGALSSFEDLKMIQVIRKRTKFLIALGDCAVTGNVPAMRNSIPVPTLLNKVYMESVQANPCVPSDGVPSLMKHAIPLHESVKVDLHVPGCPPKAEAIAFVLGELLEGRKPELASKVKFG